ncbi:MAG: MarC family protein [Cyanobacteria bacterium J06626_14]
MKLLGRAGLRAFTQILGFFILAIAVQMVSEGVQNDMHQPDDDTRDKQIAV